MNEVQMISGKVISIKPIKWLQLKVACSIIVAAARSSFKAIGTQLRVLGVKWREEALRGAEIERALAREKVRLHERFPFRGYGH
ncbi:hypothetical protein WDW37_20745 [Bdellovibrionota bacterium FG-1]